MVASCQFGSVHRKEFRLLLTGIDEVKMTVKCPGGHSHVPIQGAYTQPSAVCTDGVADHFAEAFAVALRQKREAELADVWGGKHIENVFVKDTDILRASPWVLDRAW